MPADWPSGNRCGENRIRAARFAARKTLAEYDFTFPSSDEKTPETVFETSANRARSA